MTVIVQSDSLAAWLALAGVGVGALLTAGTAWLQGRSAERKDKRREVSRAIDELVASANALKVTVSAFVVSRNDPGATRDWVPAITALLERVQKADATIARLSEPALADAADKLAEEAREFAHGFGTAQHDAAVLQQKIDAFSAASRAAKDLYH